MRRACRPALPTIAVLVLLAAVLAPAAPAETPPELGAASYGEVVDVELANVEVVVTDRDGNPVPGLLAADFEVFEDGEPVDVTHFFAVDRRGAPLSPELIEAFPGEATQKLHLVILVDGAGLEMAGRAALLGGLEQALDRAFELEGRVMLASLDGGLTVEVPFSRDREAIQAALDRIGREVTLTGLEAERRILLSAIASAAQPEFQRGGLVPASRDFEVAVDAAYRILGDAQRIAEREAQGVRRTVTEVRRLLDSVGGLPGRKAVLLLSGGMPLRAGESWAEIWRAKFQAWIDRNSLAVPSGVDQQILVGLRDLEGSRFDTQEEVEALGHHAAAQRVTFYPVVKTASLLSRPETFGGEAFRAGATLEAFSREASLVDVARLTGGEVWLTGQGVAAAIERLARDSESYYSLGYAPASTPADGKFRKVEVKVKRPGLEAHHAAGYVAKDAATRLREATIAALHHGGGDNPLGIRLESGASSPAPGKTKRALVPLQVFIPYRGLLLQPDAASHRARLKLVVAVRDVDSGATSKPQEIDLPVSIPNERLQDALQGIAVYPLQLELGNGSKEIAIGLRDELARVESTLRVAIAVGAAG